MKKKKVSKTFEELFDENVFENMKKVREPESGNEKYVDAKATQPQWAHSYNPAIYEDKNIDRMTFKDFLKEDYANKLTPLIEKEYKKSKPKDIAYMLYALSDLGILVDMPLNLNRTHLAKALNESGIKINRQDLGYHFTTLTSAPNKDEVKIKHHKEKIKSLLNI